MRDELPGGARVVGHEEAAVLGLDLRVDAVRVGARNRDADLAEDAFGQAGVAGDFGPGVAAVGGLEDAAARAARATSRATSGTASHKAT